MDEKLKITDFFDCAVYRAQGDYPTAVNSYKRCFDIRKEIVDRRGLAEILLILGKICQTQKEYKSARENYLAALQIYEELQSPDKEIVMQRLDDLKNEIGEELFEKYRKETSTLITLKLKEGLR
jgi:tetratricopeptide (TPR) repeat protein